MNFFKQHAFLLFHVVSIFCSFGLIQGYILPIYITNGPVCIAKSANGECIDQSQVKMTNMSELFSFVARTTDITARWMNDQVNTAYRLFYKEPEKPPKESSYFDMVWTYLGLHEEPKQEVTEHISGNIYVLGLILTFYFAYVFMATKYFSECNAFQMLSEVKPCPVFLPFVAEANGNCEGDVESEDEPTSVFQSKCEKCSHSILLRLLTRDHDKP